MHLSHMDDCGLDKWMEDLPERDGPKFSRSLFPHERVALDSLNERILELERMRDQILYEIGKLKGIVENH